MYCHTGLVFFYIDPSVEKHNRQHYRNISLVQMIKYHYSILLHKWNITCMDISANLHVNNWRFFILPLLTVCYFGYCEYYALCGKTNIVNANEQNNLKKNEK